MSLINQMLDDLDRRTPAGVPAESGLLSGIASTNRRWMRPRLFWLSLPSLLLIAAAAAAWMWTTGWPSACRVSIPVIPEAAAAVRKATVDISEAPLVRAVLDPDPPIEPPSAAADRSPAALERLVIVQVGEQLRVAAEFSHLPAYRLTRQSEGRQLTLELPAGTRTASLPDSGSPLLQKISCTAEDGQVRLVFSFDRACRYEELHSADNSHAEGRTLVFVVEPEQSAIGPAAVAEPSRPIAPPVTLRRQRVDVEATDPPAVAPEVGTFVRQTVQPPPRQQAEERWHAGIDAFRRGRLAEAETSLRAALEAAADHVGARDALLQLLERQDRGNERKALLAAGVREVPGHLPYRLHYVRLLIEDGDLSAARTELTRAPLPPAGEVPDLHALLATVNLRQGRYREAADAYRSLLAVQPEQAVWWMGLGIALEGDAAVDQARQAYGQALDHDGLSEGLQQFIRQRLAASGKAPTRQPSTSGDTDEDRS